MFPGYCDNSDTQRLVVSMPCNWLSGILGSAPSSKFSVGDIVHKIYRTKIRNVVIGVQRCLMFDFEWLQISNKFKVKAGESLRVVVGCQEVSAERRCGAAYGQCSRNVSTFSAHMRGCWTTRNGLVLRDGHGQGTTADGGT